MTFTVMTDVVDLVEDKERIKYASNTGEAVRALTAIIRRLPAPRAYLVEPHIKPRHPDAVLWELGLDILSAQLTLAGTSVISPDTLRTLASWNRSFFNGLSARNPLIRIFMYTKDLLSEIYLPTQGDVIAQDIFKGYEASAKKKGITTYRWEPARIQIVQVSTVKS